VARVEFEDVALTNAGVPVSGASVTVYNVNTDGSQGSLATIYLSEAGTTKANPFNTGADGYIDFWADGGNRYNIVISGAGFGGRIIRWDAYSAIPSTSPTGVGFILDFAGVEANVPAWGVVADGRYLDNIVYAKSFAAIGSQWNNFRGLASPPAGTHRVPDVRGLFTVGKVNMGTGNPTTPAVVGANSTRATTLAGILGEEFHTLAITEIPSHNHGGVTGTNSVDHTHTGTTNGESTNHSHTVASHSHGGGNHTHATDVPIGPSSSNGGGSGVSQATGNFNPFPSPVILNSGTIIALEAPGTGFQSVAHNHTFTSAGASVTHTHSVAAQGGGGAHENLPPCAVVNKIYACV
jgi:microcystin-dependent protein